MSIHGCVPAATTLIARQPVVNRNARLFGYELLYRDQDLESANVSDNDRATAHVVLSGFLEIGLDQIAGEGRVLINTGANFLQSDLFLDLPPSKVVIEVLGSMAPTAANINALERCRQAGFTIVLDDFQPTGTQAPLLPYVDFVKIDIRNLSESEVERAVAYLGTWGIALIAKKVETESGFEWCKRLGFDYFQGFFFLEPEVIIARRAATHGMGALHLLGLLSDPDISMDKLARHIERDATLSFKLLQFLRSAYFGRSVTVGSVVHATWMLGLRNVQRLAALVLLAGMDDQPTMVLSHALLRAHACEHVLELGQYPNPADGFTIGLLSVADALSGRPMEEVAQQLPLYEDLRRALLGQPTPLGRALKDVIAYSQGDWDDLGGAGTDVGVLQVACTRGLLAANESVRTLMGIRRAGG